MAYTVTRVAVEHNGRTKRAFYTATGTGANFTIATGMRVVSAFGYNVTDGAQDSTITNSAGTLTVTPGTANDAINVVVDGV